MRRRKRDETRADYVEAAMAEHKLSWGDLGVGKSVVSRLLDPSDDGAGFQIGTLRRAAAQLQCNWQDLAEP